MPHHHTSICHMIIPPVDLVEPVGHFLDKARELLAGRNEGGQYFQGMPVSMCKSLSTLHPPPSTLHPPPSSLHPPPYILHANLETQEVSVSHI